MYNKILVPLDGSKLAECALPHVEVLVKGCDTTNVILVSVTERVQGYRVLEGGGQPLGQRLIPEAFGKKQKQAQTYLDRIAKTLAAKGINVSAFGIGDDFSEEMMQAIAEHGMGDYFFIDGADTIPRIVEEGLEGLGPQQ